ncbi:hypothetical protein FHS47_001190 [Lutibacter sp. SG786]|nr:hypothetical protein [Luteibacter sp. SG786]
MPTGFRSISAFDEIRSRYGVRFVGWARLAASHRRQCRFLGASTRSPRREDLRRSLRKESRCAAQCLMASPRRTRAPGRGSSTRLPASAKTAGRPGRPPSGLFRPATLDSRHRGEGNGYWQRTARVGVRRAEAGADGCSRILPTEALGACLRRHDGRWGAARLSHRALVGAASLCVGAASAAMVARGKLARCRGIAGIAGSHREHWAIVFSWEPRPGLLAAMAAPTATPRIPVPHPSQPSYLPNRRACEGRHPATQPWKVATNRTNDAAPRTTQHPTAPSDAGSRRPRRDVWSRGRLGGKGPKGAGQDGPPFPPRQEAESETPARTPGSAAASAIRH